VAGDDDHHHADGEDEDVAVLDQKGRHVARLEEQPIREDLEQQDQCGERDHHAVLTEVTAEGLGDLRPGRLWRRVGSDSGRLGGHRQSAFR